MFPTRRLRRLRRTPKMRELVRETTLDASDMICPVLVQEGISERVKIGSMSDIERLPLDELNDEVGKIVDLGIPAVMLFGVPSHKDESGSSAFDSNGIVQNAISRIRESFGDKVVIMSDVCLCQYTSAGHCGVVQGDSILNDQSNELLARVAASHAAAGVDVVAPSAMMDGQVGAIRTELDDSGFTDVSVMPHATKHRSSLYSPFRDAAECAPKFGDRKTYQIPFTNSREAMAEVEMDVVEGADIVMVKPALSCLDLIAEARSRFDVPIAAYSVSGEYAMVKGAALQGWIDEKEVMREILYAIKRAGADMIVTYFAKQAAEFIQGP